MTSMTARIQEKIQPIVADHQLAVASEAGEHIVIRAAMQRLVHQQCAQDIAQQIAVDLQEQAHQQIAAVVTLCLRTIFGPNYGFRIAFEQKRGKTEAQLILTKNGHEIADPVHEDSGGVLDLASFALRLSCLLMRKPKLQRILIMDEPFKSLSVEYRKPVRELLEKLSRDFKTQIIIATHMDAIVSGKVIQL